MPALPVSHEETARWHVPLAVFFSVCLLVRRLTYKRKDSGTTFRSTLNTTGTR